MCLGTSSSGAGNASRFGGLKESWPQINADDADPEMRRKLFSDPRHLRLSAAKSFSGLQLFSCPQFKETYLIFFFIPEPFREPLMLSQIALTFVAENDPFGF